MAIARLSVGTGSKGKASPHAKYIAREGKYAKANDSLEKLEFTGHGNMPKWAEHEPNYFWQMSDEHERKNGSTYREHVIALPRELSIDQRHELILDWIKREIGDKHAYQYAIHNPPALDGLEQPHCHLMFSERTRDGIERDPEQYFKRYNAKNPDKGGAKKANTGMKPADRRADLLAQRERWEQTCNAHLEKSGSDSRISMQSLKAQGIKRAPVNMTMTQFNTPGINNSYREWLKAREESRKATAESQQINVSAELAHIRTEQAAIEQQRTEQQLELDQERIEDISDNIGLIAHYVTHFSTNGADTVGDEGFYFDPAQQQKLDNFTAELAENWQIDRNDPSWRRSMIQKFHSDVDESFISDNLEILSMAQQPHEHREHAKQVFEPPMQPQSNPLSTQTAEPTTRAIKKRRP